MIDTTSVSCPLVSVSRHQENKMVNGLAYKERLDCHLHRCWKPVARKEVTKFL